MSLTAAEFNIWYEKQTFPKMVKTTTEVWAYASELFDDEPTAVDSNTLLLLLNVKLCDKTQDIIYATVLTADGRKKHTVQAAEYFLMFPIFKEIVDGV